MIGGDSTRFINQRLMGIGLHVKHIVKKMFSLPMSVTFNLHVGPWKIETISTNPSVSLRLLLASSLILTTFICFYKL